ncbi:MAG: glycosyltransferase family 39 protein [Gemmatimonadaceae bacterium]
MSSRTLYAVGALLLSVAAVAMPTGWYDTIPRFSGVENLPFSGASLLRLIIAFEALILGALAYRDPRYVARQTGVEAALPGRRHVDFDVGASAAGALLVAITLLGLWLRAHRLDLDLWLDEISPLRDYGRLSAAQVIGSYLRSNNHLLNTLSEKAAISAFGESEWSVRLPAVTFGVLAIPTLYWFARFGLSRIASLGAALLLACSYHHIFFSQNARGYTGYLLFALLSTGMLLRALRDDRLWLWVTYVACVVLGMASLILTGFVIAGHVLFSATLVWRLRKKREVAGPLARHITAALFIAGLLAFQIYAAALPEAYVTLTKVYTEPSTGFSLFSIEFFNEMIRGVTVGFGSPLVALIFLIAGTLGFAALLRTSQALAISLILPPILTVVVLIARGLTFSPRFFLLAVPLAMLSAAAALQVIASWISSRRRDSTVTPRILCAAGLILIAAASMRSLGYYYRTPKQPYRSAIQFLEERGDSSRVVIVGSAETGFRYYLLRAYARDSASFAYTRSTTQFDSLTLAATSAHTRVVTTFSRSLRIDYPGIDARLAAGWQRDTTFSATIGDGEIVVWSRRERSGGT